MDAAAQQDKDQRLRNVAQQGSQKEPGRARIAHPGQQIGDEIVAHRQQADDQCRGKGIVRDDAVQPGNALSKLAVDQIASEKNGCNRM